MVVIRLSRGGAKKNPFYRVVAADKRFARDGRYIEQLGYYNPSARGKETALEINMERMKHWEGCGAQMSDRVASLVKSIKSNKAPTAGIARNEAKKQQTVLAEQAAKKRAEVKAAEEAAAAELAAKEKAEADAKAAAEAKAAEQAKAEEAKAEEAKAEDADKASE